MIEATLAESGGRVAGPTGAAAQLGIPVSTLESKLKSLKIVKHRFKLSWPHYLVSNNPINFSEISLTIEISLPNSFRGFSVFNHLRLAFVLLIRFRLAFLAELDDRRQMTFRIQTSVDWNVVIFRLSGQLNVESVYELQRLFGVHGHGRTFILDLEDVGLVDRDALKFLARCKANGAQLKDCPEYILEWIFRDGHKG